MFKITNNNKTLNIRIRSDSTEIISKAGSDSSVDLTFSHSAFWSISFDLSKARKPISSFLTRRFSSFCFSFSLFSAYNEVRLYTARLKNKLLLTFTFSSKELYVNLTLPASNVSERLSSQTKVAKSSKVVLTCKYTVELWFK